MNEGLVIDTINFGINNKTILIFSKDSILEKFFIYPPKNSFNLFDKYNRLDYFMIISYEIQKKGNRFDFEIIDEFSALKTDYKKIITCAILSDLLKNSLVEGEKSNIDYKKVKYFIDFLIKQLNVDIKSYLSLVILFIYYLISNSGEISFSFDNYEQEMISESNLFFDLYHNQFIITNKLDFNQFEPDQTKSNQNDFNKPLYNQSRFNGLDFQSQNYLKCPKHIFSILDFNAESFDKIYYHLNILEKYEIKILNNLLFFLSNLFKLAYHRKNIKSLEFVKYL